MDRKPLFKKKISKKSSTSKVSSKDVDESSSHLSPVRKRIEKRMSSKSNVGSKETTQAPNYTNQLL